MKSIVGWILATVTLLATALPSTALAQRHDRGWHGDIHYFDSRDMHHWRSGYWHHGAHGGRIGWWWVIGGAWYFYPQPVYPYPDPYRPPVVVVEQAPPPVVVQVPAPAPLPAQPAAPAAPAPQFWYYCDAAKAYYPYVATCPSGWQTVPATPAAGGTQ